MAPLSHYLVISTTLFAIGAMGVLIKRNILVIFMCIELMLNAVNLAFVAISRHLGTMQGQVFVFLSLVVAAAEVAVGLAIIVALFQTRGTVNVDEVNLLKW